MKITDDVTDAQRVEVLAQSIEFMTARLKRATDLLRDWRDKYGGKEHFKFTGGGGLGASPTDLLASTTRFLEGR